MSVLQRYQAVRKSVDDVCRDCGRDPESVLLLPVSKTKPEEMILELYQAGIRDFGENYVQELRAKEESLPKDIRWHMIGHLQRNKVRFIAPYVAMIHSVDSLRLAETIETEAAKKNVIVPVLLEVNVAEEESKFGLRVNEVEPLLAKIRDFSHIKVRGLMTIPPISRKIGDNRKFFQEMLQLSVDISAKKYDNVSVDCLSMGMSDDFEDAVACGSTMVRVGTAIFGARDYTKSHQK